jgi:hypothetical protein
VGFEPTDGSPRQRFSRPIGAPSRPGTSRTKGPLTCRFASLLFPSIPHVSPPIVAPKWPRSRSWVAQSAARRTIGWPGVLARVDLISTRTVAALGRSCSRSHDLRVRHPLAFLIGPDSTVRLRMPRAGGSAPPRCVRWQGAWRRAGGVDDSSTTQFRELVDSIGARASRARRWLGTGSSVVDPGIVEAVEAVRTL